MEGHSRFSNIFLKQISTTHNSTARDSTPQRNPPLLSSLFSHTILSHVSRQIPKLSLTKKSLLLSFPEFGGLLQGPGYFWVGIGGQNKKNPLGNHFPPMVSSLSSHGEHAIMCQAVLRKRLNEARTSLKTTSAMPLQAAGNKTCTSCFTKLTL